MTNHSKEVIEFDKASFNDSVMQLRSLSFGSDRPMLFVDGAYVMSSNDAVAMVFDMENKEASVVGPRGSVSQVEKINMSDDGDQVIADIVTGFGSDFTDRVTSLVRAAAPYLASGFTISDKEWDEPITGGTTINGLPPLLAAPHVEIPPVHVRQQRAKDALIWLCGSKPNLESVERVAHELGCQASTYMSKFDGETGKNIIGLYDRHIIGMQGLTGIIEPNQKLSLVRDSEADLYSTFEFLNDREPTYIVPPFKLGLDDDVAPSAILTPLPWIVIIRFPKQWFIDNKGVLANDQYLGALYTSGKRHFCDVHVPTFWHGGFDRYLFRPMQSPMKYFMRDPSNFPLYVENVINWMNGVGVWAKGFEPSTLVTQSMASVMGSGNLYPNVAGPTRYHYYQRQFATMRGSYYRNEKEYPGTAQASFPQSRNGMQNDTVSRMLGNYINGLGTPGVRMMHYPIDHALGMFYRLITGRNLDELKQLLSR